MTAAVHSSVPARSLLTGNLPDFARDPLGFLESAARDHGPVAKLRFGRSRAVLLSDPSLIEDVLVTQRHNFIKARPLRALHRLFGRGLLTNEGESWKRQRRLAQPAFQPRSLAAHSSVVASRAARTTAQWKTGESFDMHEEMKRLLMTIIAESLFGAEVSERAAVIGLALESTMDHYSARRGISRLAPDWVPLSENRKYLAGVKELEDFVASAVESRKQSDIKRHDLLSMLLSARDEAGNPMSPRQLRDEAITLFVGGFDTPALALSWTWYLLSKHPQSAEKVRVEVDSLLEGRVPQYEELPRLKFCECVIKESMRLYPPAWLLSREATRDTSIGGHGVPAGTSVMMSPWVMHRDERFFARASEFIPERWQTGETSGIPRFAYFPFGGGPRVCIGAAYAMMETTLILAMLAQHFGFVTDDRADVTPRASMTLRPRGGIPAVIRRR